MALYIDNVNKSTYQKKAVRTFWKFVGHKQELIVFLHSNNEQSKNEINYTISFKIVSK